MNIKEHIIRMHNEMYKLTIESKVKEKRYKSVILDLEEFTEQELTNLFNWILSIYDNQYKELKKIKDLLPDETWKRYKDFGIVGLREQYLLRDAQYDLRKVWETPYRTEKQKNRIKRLTEEAAQKAAKENMPE